jgi:signal transduction histidine kinase
MPTPVYENIDVKAALQQVIDLYSVDATSEIVFRCPDGLSISFDRNYFTRSIGNVLKNALQAIPEDRKGRIEITVEQHPNHVSITIADNGTGMNAQQASKIFMPYFSTKVTGMGLGLPIVKNMIESGNGTIHFTTKEQEGTTFIITLPL